MPPSSTTTTTSSFSDTLDPQCSGDESTFRKDDNDCSSGKLLLGTKALTVDDSGRPSQRTELQSLIPATTDISLPMSACPMDPLTPSCTATTLSLWSSTPQTTPQLKPPDTMRYQSFRPGRHKYESRASRLVAARDSVERTHGKQLERTTMRTPLLPKSPTTKSRRRAMASLAVPYAWSFTAHEVEGHRWSCTNYFFVLPSLSLQSSMSEVPYHRIPTM
ncbi:hypothetical protein EDB19DRAFT_1909362 [Suillus lakei]|nr:hypothetical protein EDB19DRAFT_1909362 [Suillus lakei]